MSEKETIVATEYALLPLVLRALNHDRKIFMASKLKFDQFYFDIIETAMRKCKKDITATTKDVFQYHMHIRLLNWLHVNVKVRGEEFNLELQKPVALEWIAARAKQYLSLY
jgi:hypothetical protein